MNAEHRPTILIADDEPLIVSVLARLAKRSGLHFITDSTSEHVLELAIQHQPEVIILDVRQHIDGRDLLAALKRDERTKNIKVVMLSAVDDEFTRSLCFDLGCEDYETKPFDSRFMAKVARLAGIDPEVARAC